MTTVDFNELYKEVQAGGAIGIEGGTYRLRVVLARPYAQSNLLYLTMEVQTGPLAGKQAEVNIYLPKEGDKPFTRTMFARKLAGFQLSQETFSAMQAAGDTAAVLEILGQALLNRQVDGVIVLRDEKAGQYAGTNELALTTPVGGEAPAAPAAVPAPAPVTVAPTGSGTDSAGTVPVPTPQF